MAPLRPSWPWWRSSLTGLSALGLALSVYLSWHYLMGGSVIGCGGESQCDLVLTSRWSSVGGVLPISGLAAGAYLALLIASFFIGPATAAPDRRLAWHAMLILTGTAAGCAVWFTILQEWVLGSFCPYCMATHIIGLLLAALVIWQAPKQFNPSAADTPSPAPRRILALFGLSIAGILVVCQIVWTSPVVYRRGESQTDLPALDPHTVPLLGSPDAPYVVTLLFDYNCPHCQHVHSLLEEAIRRYNGKLAFVLSPAPLNNHCNPYIAREVDEFKNSCELAKIGLAVWVAKRHAFPDFDHWMFSADPSESWHPRSIDAAKAKAIELVGQTKFDAAQADPWVNQFLQTSVQLYGATLRSDHNGSAIPKLVFGQRWVTPEPNDANDLLSILQTTLALPKP
jgi:uncharacterized membrane protein